MNFFVDNTFFMSTIVFCGRFILFLCLDIPKPSTLDGQSFAAKLTDGTNSIELAGASLNRQILVQHIGEGSTETFNPACGEYQPEDNLMVNNMLTKILSTKINQYILFTQRVANVSSAAIVRTRKTVHMCVCANSTNTIIFYTANSMMMRFAYYFSIPRTYAHIYLMVS